MSASLRQGWTKASFPSPSEIQESESKNKLQKVVSALDSVESTGKPSMVFFRNTTKKGSGKSATMTKNCRTSGVIDEHVFFTKGPNLCGRPTSGSRFDFRGAVAAKFINAVVVDMPVDEQPMVVVTGADGKVAKVLTGTAIKPASVYSAVASVLKKAGNKTASADITKGAKMLAALYKLDVSIQSSALTAKSPFQLKKLEQMRATKAKGDQMYRDLIRKAQDSLVKA